MIFVTDQDFILAKQNTMKTPLDLKIVLFIGAAMFLLAGSIAMLSPDSFTSRNDIDISGQISLYNDYRGMGGLLIGGGLIIMAGVFRSKMAFTSVVTATVMYLCFSGGRWLSFIIEGQPAEGLLKATVVETVVGLLSFFALIRYQKKLKNQSQS